MQIGESHSYTFPRAITGTPPFDYAIVEQLPAGLFFDSATRILSGSPTELFEEREFTYLITDSQGPTPRSIAQAFKLAVVAPLQWDPDSANSEGINDLVTQVENLAETDIIIQFPYATGGRNPLQYELLNAEGNPVTNNDLPDGIRYDSDNLRLRGAATGAFDRARFTWRVYDSRPSWQGSPRELRYNFHIQITQNPPSAPQSLNFTSVNSFQIGWVWNNPSDTSRILFYDFQWRLNEAGAAWGEIIRIDVDTPLVGSTLDNGYLISGLLPGTNIEVRVRSNGGINGNSAWVNATGTTDSLAFPPLPDGGVVTGLTVSDITANGATVSWDAHTATYMFQYQYSYTGLSGAQTTTDASVDLTNLLPGTTYTFSIAIQRTDAFGRGENVLISFTTLGSALSDVTVQNLRVLEADITDTSAIVRWDAPIEGTPTEYQYTVSGRAGVFSTSSSSISLTGLTRGTAYSVSVWPFFGTQSGRGTSDTVSFRTTGSSFFAPSTPQSLNFTSVNSFQIGWVWNNPSDTSRILFYDFQWRLNEAGAAWGEIIRIDVDTPLVGSTLDNGYLISGLLPGTNIEVRVRSNGGINGNSAWVNATGITDSLAFPPLPDGGVVTGLTVSDITANGATVSWDAHTATYMFQYQYSYTGLSSPQTTTDASVDLTNLLPGTTYTFSIAIQRTDAFGRGENVLISFTTAEEIVPIGNTPGIVQNITVTNVGANGATVSWGAPVDGGPVTGYKYKISRLLGVFSTSSLSASIAGLDSGTFYRVTVWAYNDDGEGIAANVAFTTTGDVPIDQGNPPGPVVSLSSSNVDDDSATVSWQPPTSGGSVLGYQYTVSGLAGIFTLTATTFNLSGLESGRTYTVTVWAYNDDGESETRDETFTTTGASESPPGPVRSLVAGSITETSATISWEAPRSGGPFTEYQYTVSGRAGVFSTSNTSVDLTGFTRGTSYSVTVWAARTGQNGPNRTVSFTTRQPAPPPPGNLPGPVVSLSSSSVDEDSATVSWQPPTSGGSVSGYRYTVSGRAGVFSTSSSSISLTGLESGISYSVTVWAYNSDGSGSSRTVSFTTTGTAPIIPGNLPGPVVSLSSSSVDEDSATVSWQPPTSGGSVSGYRYTVSGRAGVFSTSSSSISLTGLESGTLYTVTVWAYNDDGSGSSRSTAFRTDNMTIDPGNPPGPVVSLSSSSVDEDSATVSWQPPTSGGTVSGYRYIRSDQPGQQTTSSTSINLTGLSSVTSYTITVWAYNDDGSGSTRSVSFTTTGTTANPPGPVVSLSSSSVDDDSATVSWQPPTSGGSVSGYRYTVSGRAGVFSTSSSSISLSGLSSDTSYTVTVWAYNSDGGGPSRSTTFRTDNIPPPVIIMLNPPGPVVSLSSSSVDEDSATVSWQPPTSGGSVSGYRYTISGRAGVFSTSSSSISLSGLSSDTSYTVTVWAYNSDGSGSSRSTTFTTDSEEITTSDLAFDPTSASIATPQRQYFSYAMPYATGGTLPRSYTVTGVGWLSHVSANIYGGTPPQTQGDQTYIATRTCTDADGNQATFTLFIRATA